MRIQLEQLGQFLVTAATAFEGFQTRIQTALLLVQKSGEQDQGRL